MTARDIISPLVAQLIGSNLVELNSQLREVRSSFAAHGQFGSSRMAISAREVCEASARKMAESLFTVFEEALKAKRIASSVEAEAEAKDAFMFELSAAFARVEALQRDNSGQYFQPISVATLSTAGLARISNLYSTARAADVKANVGFWLSVAQALAAIWRNIAGLWK
jgi:hypothetical protein